MPLPEPPRVSCDPLKTLFDKLFALIALLLASPLMLLIATAIKLEGLFDSRASGPAFYHQIRISEGRPFPFYKFRITWTMPHEEAASQRRDRFKTLEGDQYCTRTGKWLKKWYLDELPQLFNILRGDMSWVGPRPFPVDDYEEDLKKGDFRKKIIRAGLTGLVQMNKGHDAGTDVDLDNEYISRCREYSPPRRLVYDLGIILRTAKTVFEGKGL